MFNFFHRMMNPHCPQCIAERECKNCDTLRSLLEQERFEKNKLLESILQKPVSEPSAPISELEEVRPKFTPWRVRQQLLEQEDRAKAKILREQDNQGIVNNSHKSLRESQQIEELEKELGIGVENAR